VVCEENPNAGGREAEVSRGLAADDTMRDDSHCLSFFSPGSDRHSQGYDKALSRSFSYVSVGNVEDAIKFVAHISPTSSQQSSLAVFPYLAHDL